MRKALMNASVASMIYKFNMNNIKILQSMGYQVDVACNFGKENPVSLSIIERFKQQLESDGIHVYNTFCPRNIFFFRDIVSTYRQLKKLADSKQYDLVHTQSPIGSVVCRLAFRKARAKGTKVIYQAHGFHFFQGAPKSNWIVFYPVEKLCSYFTDILITINREDYTLAQKKMKAKKVVYVPGVGVDLKKLQTYKDTNKDLTRQEIGVPDNYTWLLTVGELIPRKNHEILIKAVAQLENCYLTIAGTGALKSQLQKLIVDLGVSDRVKLLGFRNDIFNLCHAADIFVFPSLQEGLPVALMEAMACGLPCVVSKIRGNTDLIDEAGGGIFDPYSVSDIVHVLNNIRFKDLQSMGLYNINKVQQFDITNVSNQMAKIYKAI